MVLVIKIYALRLPFSDEWTWAELIYRFRLGSLSFADLWYQHNEHRMLFPNLIALGLASLGGWSQLRESLFSLLVAVITQIGVFVLLRRAITPGRLPYAFLIASLLLYSLAQIENWDWGFQIAWFLCNACAVWALLLLGSAGQSWFALIAAMIIATVASFSSSQGLMIWPAGVATLLLVQKRRPAQIVIWIGVAVGIFFVYFHGFQKPVVSPNLLILAPSPLEYIAFFGAYFGSVFANWLNFWVCVVVGWAGIVALALMVMRAVLRYRADRVTGSRVASWIGIVVYALATAAITTIGRIGFGEAQALASRYVSISIYLWMTISTLAFVSVRVQAKGSERAMLAVGVLAILAILYAGSDRAGLRLGGARQGLVRSALPAMIAGGGPQLTVLHPSESYVERELRQLKAVKDGPYYQ
jgi:hypothetical protein